MITKYTFDAANNYPESCNQTQGASPRQPAVFPVSKGRRYVSVAGNVPAGWVKADVHEID